MWMPWFSDFPHTRKKEEERTINNLTFFSEFCVTECAKMWLTVLLVHSRNCPGCHQSLWEPAHLRSRYYQCLQWAKHGRYGPPYLCSSWGSIQTNGQVLWFLFYLLISSVIWILFFYSLSLKAYFCFIKNPGISFLIQRSKKSVHNSQRWIWGRKNGFC